MRRPNYNYLRVLPVLNPERPPADWWYATIKRLQQQERYRNYTQEQLNRIAGSIWYKKLSPAKRRLISSTENPIKRTKRKRTAVRSAKSSAKSALPMLLLAAAVGGLVWWKNRNP
jgi:hypothetical protein